MAFAAVVFCGLLATASGAASLAEVIDVPHTVVYQHGTLGSSSSLLQGEAVQEHEEALGRMSMLSFEVKEQILEDGKEQEGILAPHRKPTAVASALQSEGLSGAFEILEEHNKPELRKALATAMSMKENKAIDHMTLEETLAKQELLKDQLKTAGQQFAELFDAVSTRYSECQQCLSDCPARNFGPYDVKNEKDCMKNCELVICKETWNPLAGSYAQQLAEFKLREEASIEYAKPSLFTNYLDDYLEKKGEQSMFYDDEDEDTEIVYDAPTQEQLQKDEEHDRKLERFLFVFNPSEVPANFRVPAHYDMRRVSNKKEADVLSMQPPEDEAAKRLSMTAREAEIISKSSVFGVPAEWIPGMEQ